MPWKLDDKGQFVVDENKNPIFVLDGGEEKSVDYTAMSTALTKANKEAMERKNKLKEQEVILSALDGIENVSEFVSTAKKNAEAVKSMGEKEKDAETMARARVEAAVTPLQKQIAELERGKAEADARYHKAMIDSQFSTSAYVNNELVSPALAKDLFAKHFTVNEEGNIQATDQNGEVVYDTNGVAGFDSALRTLVAKSSYKDIVTKGTGSNGSDAKNNQSSGQGRNTPKSLADCKTQEERNAYLNNEANLRKVGR